MTVRKDRQIPDRTEAGRTDQSDWNLDDENLEEFTGGADGADEWSDSDSDDPDADIDVIEGSIRPRSGSRR